MPDTTNSKPPIIVLSNNVAGGASSAKDKDGGSFKIGDFKVNNKMLYTVGGLVAIGLAAYYINGQLPIWIDQINSIGQQPATSGTTAVSGASAAIPPADVSTYPGTGAGSFPPPATGIGQYPYTTQPYPTTYPYQIAPTAAIAAQTPMPGTALGSSVVRSYHAHMTPHHYLDHHGKQRSFITEMHIEELIGSEQDTKRVLSLDEE
jgi:hypothetical protein